MFKKVLEYAGPYKRKIFAATCTVMFSVLMGVLPFFFAYQIILPIISGEEISAGYALIRIGGVFVCLVLQAWFYGTGLDISHNAAYNTLLNLRESLQARFEKLPLGVIEDKGTGVIKKLFVDDVDSMELLLAHTLPEGLANLLVPIVVYIAMFITDWKLALMSLAAIPLGLASMMIMYSLGTSRMGAYYKAAQVMNNTIIEYINGMEVVKVFNKDGESYQRFRTDVLNYRDFTLDWYKACRPWTSIYNCILPCTTILTLPLGSYFVLKGYSSLADLVLILCLSLSIGIPLLKSISFIPAFPQLEYKISALEQVLSAEPLKDNNNRFKGKDFNICYKNVSFSYDEEEVLHNVSFTAGAGQRTALIGESGSGKSTLAKLLIHYYDIQKGSITIGGQDICDMSLAALNEQISYVAQDQYLFNTSILENIRVGKLSATDEEVYAAAEKAQCMEFIDKLPNGIQYTVGGGGKMLSGGQRQRIAIARAILKNAPIIVLDEATAYTDPENASKLEEAISRLVEGKTLIVIAHKLSSIKGADKILVMDHGNLIASGKHDELIESCIEYEKLWNAHTRSTQWKIATETNHV